MRLSEKGYIHLNEWTIHKLPIDAFEFKPEDFTGAVTLTVEEAKTIEHCFAIFHRFFKLFSPEKKVWKELQKRIEQVEEEK